MGWLLFYNGTLIALTFGACPVDAQVLSLTRSVKVRR